MKLSSLIGGVAGSLSMIGNFPQVVKVIRRNSVDGLSVYMVLLSFTAMLLWVVYGALEHNDIIFYFNLVKVLLLSIILAYFIKGVVVVA